MKVTIDCKRLKECIESPRKLKKEFGIISERITLVLSLLTVASNLNELPNTPPTRRHKLTGEYDNCWGIDLSKNWRMIIRPEILNDDLRNITSVVVIDIVDYH